MRQKLIGFCAISCLVSALFCWVFGMVYAVGLVFNADVMVEVGWRKLTGFAVAGVLNFLVLAVARATD